MSKDIELLMSDLMIEQAVVAGHSMGGKVAMSLALTKVSQFTQLVQSDLIISDKLSISVGLLDKGTSQ